MSRSIICNLCIMVFFLAGSLPPALVVQAENAATGNIYNLKTAAFPNIQFSVDAYDASGNFITDLEKTNFLIIEDGKKHSPDNVQVFDPGVEFVVAINPGRSFAILDNQGVSRFEKVAKALRNWANSLPSQVSDAYSLVTAGGPSTFHTRDLKSWLTSLNAYQPKSKDLTPSFDILSRAIDIASGSMLEPGARRAILFITPMAETADISTMQSLALRASQLNVHVFVWVISSADSPTTPGFLGLQDLAIQTGGQFFLFSGSESLPDPSGYLNPFRSAYQLMYNSGLTSSGSHTIAVSILTNQAGTIDLTPVSFELDIQPPNPILITPPKEILRQPVDASHYDINTLTPAQHKLEMIIEFPDDHPRELASTSLIVDGQTIITNTSEPFNQFIWDLSGFVSSGKHDIQVAVVDMLGLQKTSISIPILVVIAGAPPVWTIFLEKYGKWISTGVIILASLLLVWLLLRMYKKQRKYQDSRRTTSRSSIINDDEKFSILRRQVKKASANLMPLPTEGSNQVSGNLQLVAKEIKLGADAEQADYLLIDPSIEPLHAIVYKQGNSYFISDQDSLAGTWINYERLPAGTHNLNHGDIIHFGLLAYRFLLNDPTGPPGTRITLEKINSDL